MSGSNQPPIIIKKKRKSHAHEHHGGAWKVAYADFVTAMMAFFLLLWLLNVTTDDQRRGIADYFDPSSISRGTSGSGGVLGGLTVGSPGQMSSPGARFSLDRSLPGRPEPVPESQNIDEEAADDPPPDDVELADAVAQYLEAPEERRQEILEGVREELGDEAADQLAAELERQQFDAATEQLQQAIQTISGLEFEDLAQHLIIDEVEEGLRIQIVDQDRYSMFPRGSARMYERANQLITLVGEAIDALPNHIVISGHTDSTPFPDGSTYDNWDLSTDRAHASRRVLVESGVDTARVATVVGRAHTEPMISEDPGNPRNRRISIVLLREAPTVAEPSATASP